MQVVSGDILESDKDFIAHQCNCVSKSGLGLAKSLFDKFPNANTYKNRQRASIPGTIEFFPIRDSKQFIVNMYAQFVPGKNYNEPRLEWFQQSLNSFSDIVGKRQVSLALPYKIGCGLAGGDWNRYFNVIDTFSRKHPNIQITLYKKDSNE